ncbi:MAG: hypothetical protein FWC41_13380, partial [Firmicutes bacterium]|nr:hypothetical protein [Bacillota bacterium]
EYLASCILTYTREISDFIEKEIKIISKEEKIDKIYVDQMCIKIKNALLKCNGHIKSLEKENYSNVRFDVENYIYKNFFPKFTNKLWQEFTFLDEFDLHFDGLKEKHVKLYIIKSEHFHWAKGNSSLVFSNGLNGSDTKKLLEDGRKSKIKIVEVSFGLNLRDEKKKQIMSSLPMQEKFNTNFEGKNCKDFGVLFKIESSYEKRY